MVANALARPRAPWIIFGAGLAIRVVALALLARTPLEGDARSYHETAVDLARGAPFEPHWPPGLPLYLSLFYRVFGAHEIVGRAAMLPVFLAFSALVLALGRRLGGPVAAALALAIFAAAPIFGWTSVTPLTQLPCATLALGAVLAAERMRDGARRAAVPVTPRAQRPASWSALVGLCLAGLLLTRPSNLLLAVAVPAYLAWRTRRWQAFAIPVAVAGICVGAWTLKAHLMTGRLVLINDANAQNVFYGNNPWTPLYRTWWFGSHKKAKDPTVPRAFLRALAQINAHPARERDHLYVEQAIAHLRARPDLFVVRTASRVRTFAAFDTFTSAQLAERSRALGLFVLALDAALFVLLSALAIAFPAAFARTTDDGRTETVRLLLVVALAYALPYFFVFSHPTFHFTAVPLVGLIGAAAGARLLGTGFGPAWAALSRRERVRLVAALGVLLAIQAEWAVHVMGRAQ